MPFRAPPLPLLFYLYLSSKKKVTGSHIYHQVVKNQEGIFFKFTINKKKMSETCSLLKIYIYLKYCLEEKKEQ